MEKSAGYEGLALVEESAAEDKHTPEEPGDERITRLMDVSQLLDEIEEDRQRIRGMEKKIKQMEEGGKRKMKFSILRGMFLTGAAAAAVYFGFSSEKAKHDMQRLKESTFTASEMSQVFDLRQELEGQINDANSYFDTIADVENDYRGIVSDSLVYINSSIPNGELEEEVAKEIEGMRESFESCDADSFVSQMEGCKETCASSLERDDLAKANLKQAVQYANSLYFVSFDVAKKHSMDVIDHLQEFRTYVESHPLRQRRTMLERIDKQIEDRREIITEARMYIDMFGNNNLSDAVIPVTPREYGADLLPPNSVKNP